MIDNDNIEAHIDKISYKSDYSDGFSFRIIATVSRLMQTSLSSGLKILISHT